MLKNDEKYGWSTPPDDCVKNYINKCKLFVKEEELFNNFKRDEDYTKVLEGSSRIVGDMAVGRIYSNPHYIPWVFENLKNFKENDIYGNPVLYEYKNFGKISVGTLKYISNAADIKNSLSDEKIKTIVEVGGGYGGLCKILYHMVGFEKYILIDLPSVIELCKKYLDNFSELKDKITYISCDKFKDIKEMVNIDLFISDAAMAECDRETQTDYANKIIRKSKFAHIVYNTHHLSSQTQVWRSLLNNELKEFEFTTRIIVPGVEEYFLRQK